MKLRNPVPRISLLILASVPLYWFLISGQARMVDGALTGDEMVFPEKIYVLLPSLSIFATLGVGLSRAYKATRWGWFWLQVFVFPMTYIYTLVVDRGDGSGPPTRKQSNALLAHQPLPGVALEHNAHVRVVSGEHAGETGSLCIRSSESVEATSRLKLGMGAMVRSQLLAALLIIARMPEGIAAEPVEFNELVACDKEHDAYGPDKLLAERVGNRLLVTGWAGMACGEHVVNPRVLPDWGSLTLQIASKSQDGVVAACRCTSKFQFVITQEVPAGRTIYLVKDGKGAAHAVAP